MADKFEAHCFQFPMNILLFVYAVIFCKELWTVLSATLKNIYSETKMFNLFFIFSNKYFG